MRLFQLVFKNVFIIWENYITHNAVQKSHSEEIYACFAMNSECVFLQI